MQPVFSAQGEYRKISGEKAEQAVKFFLLSQGLFDLLSENFFCRIGEIDF